MKKWLIHYWDEEHSNPTEKWLDELADEQFKSVAKEIKMLEEIGNELKLPHSFPLSKGLFELRERRYGYRILLPLPIVVARPHLLLLLLNFNKGSLRSLIF